MEIFYIANARIPTEKAHGFTIAKMCSELAQTGSRVTLFVPKRRNTNPEELFTFYELPKSFLVVEVPVLDLFSIERYLGKGAYILEAGSFFFSLFFKLLFKKRTAKIYTREYWTILYAFLGYRISYECHWIPKYKNVFYPLNRLAHHIFVISVGIEQEYRRRGFKNVTLSPSAVDIELFSKDVEKGVARKKLDLPQDAFLLVYTGNFKTMGEEKGLRTAIEMLTDSKENVALVAVGGVEEYIHEYTELAKRSGIESRVILRGRVRQTELALYQQAADALFMVFPDTQHYRLYMSPIKMFEYMASGRPIIASDLPSITSVLTSQSAYIVAPGDQVGLKEAIEEIQSNPNEAKKRAEVARKQVGLYSWSEKAKKILTNI